MTTEGKRERERANESTLQTPDTLSPASPECGAHRVGEEREGGETSETCVSMAMPRVSALTIRMFSATSRYPADV